MSEPYLSGLQLSGRRVVVVGGGSVAQRRLPALLACAADVLVVSPRLTTTLEGLLPRPGLRWEARPYQRGDLAGAWYVLAATDDPAVNATVVQDATAQRTFCVRADDGAGGTAVTPATLTHHQEWGPALEPSLGPATEPARRTATEALGSVPGSVPGSVQVGVLAGADPRRSAAIRDGILEAIREGRLDPGPRRDVHGLPGVAIVGGGPGDPDLITVLGRRLLARADVVVADRLAPQALLAELRPSTEVIDAAKLPRGRSMAQEEINAVLVDRALTGRFVVRLKGGDPFVFGRGAEEVQACLAAGLPVRVVPGVTSALAVPGLAGIPLTHRGVAHEAVIVSGHLAPDDVSSLVDWPALARLRGTLVILMGVDRLAELVAVLLDHGRAPDTPAAVIQDGSLPQARVVSAALADLPAAAAAAAVRAPAVIVIGQVVALGQRLGAAGGPL